MESNIHRIKEITLGGIEELGGDHGFVRKIYIQSEDISYTVTMFGDKENLEIAVKTEKKI